MLGLMAIAVVCIKVLGELSDHLELWASVMPLLEAAEDFRLTALYGALLLLICAGLAARISLSRRGS